jgi:LDH2 family malate/lactate/ureidoglycolate dehydrogenase
MATPRTSLNASGESLAAPPFYADRLFMNTRRTETPVRIPMRELIEFAAALFIHEGVPEDTARYLAEVAVESEAWRQSTHGLQQIGNAMRALGRSIDPARQPQVLREGPAFAMVDGDRCFGNLAVRVAQQLAVDKAQRGGVATVTVRNTRWIGALHHHLIPIARQGMLGQLWCQCPRWPFVAPYGALEARLGTNPIAFGIPAEPDPIIADFSTSTMAAGMLKRLKAAGEKTETPRFLDAEGRPTDDPTVTDDGGTMMSIGGMVEGYKGLALSLYDEALAVLAGGSAAHPGEVPPHQNFTLIVHDPGHFVGRADFDREIKRFVEYVRSARTIEEGDSVRLPGDRGFAALRDCEHRGVPVEQRKLADLHRLAETHNVPLPPTLAAAL